jgi:DNA-binding response OmpR family regulator
MTDVRAIIAERDALRYLLDELTTIPPEVSEEMEGFSAGQRRMLGALLGQPGVAMNRAQLLAATMVDRPYADWPDPDVVDVQICKIRQRLGPDSPFKIETVWGVGYRARRRTA